MQTAMAAVKHMDMNKDTEAPRIIPFAVANHTLDAFKDALKEPRRYAQNVSHFVDIIEEYTLSSSPSPPPPSS